jgi:hypothetical protein
MHLVETAGKWKFIFLYMYNYNKGIEIRLSSTAVRNFRSLHDIQSLSELIFDQNRHFGELASDMHKHSLLQFQFWRVLVLYG